MHFRLEPGKAGKTTLADMIESLRTGVPPKLAELRKLGRTLNKRAADILASFYWPGTANGLTGFTAEFEYPLYDDVILNSVGVVVGGERQVLISTTGSPTTGAGTTQVEAVVNSLQLD